MSDANEKRNVTDIIIERLITKIETDNRMPWQRPFMTEKINWFSETEYKGINRFLLPDGEFITINQLIKYNAIHKSNFTVDGGTKSELVVFYTKKLYPLDSYKYAELERELAAKHITPVIGLRIYLSGRQGNSYTLVEYTENGWKVVSFLLRYYKVFNISDIHNLEGETLTPKIGNSILITSESADSIIDKYIKRERLLVKEVPLSMGALYNKVSDYVGMPNSKYFPISDRYYRTYFHEIAHSTGHVKRLNRESLSKYSGKNERSKEEIIAEMCSLLLASESKLTSYEDDKNSDEYIMSWIKWLKDNKSEVLNGMLQAEKAANYILYGKGTDTEEEMESEIN